MELKHLLLLLLLILYPIVWYTGTYAKAGIGEKPLIFNNAIFQLVSNLATILFIAGAVWLLFISWKMLILLFLIVMSTGFLLGMLRKRK